MAPERTLMTVPECAEALAVTVACVRRWILERKIATVKLGRLIRIPRAELNRLIEQGTSQRRHCNSTRGASRQ
jgi:excisionase family DNA binding protein